MPALAPLQRQQRSCMVLLVSLAIILILVGGVGFGIYAFATGKFNIGTPLPGTGTGTPTISIPTGNGIGVEKAPDGEYVGVSDGTFAFDTNRSDGSLKQQAAARLKAGDVAHAQILWKQAIENFPDSSSDAEVLIYQEDQQVLASGKPYITLVVGTMLTGAPSDLSAGRDDLQGAYVAQKQYNDGQKLNNGVLVRLLIANSGSQANYATAIAQQVVQAAQHDHTIIGVMGWPFSGNASAAQSVLTQAQMPMVSPTASSDTLSGISPYFFRVAPPNDAQALAGARYVEQQLHVNRVALFLDPADPYSKSLADDFRNHFTGDIVATEQYTEGQTAALPGKLQDALKANPQMIYFSGYSDDMSVLLTDLPADQPNLLVMGGDGLYGLQGYSTSSRSGFVSHLHFTAFAYPDEWKLEDPNNIPSFFTIYSRDFQGSLNVDHSANPYGYTRPDNDVMLSYDAMQALLQGCNNELTAGKTSLTSNELRQGLVKITPSNPIQGVSGQIGFGPNGDPVNKAIVVLDVDQNGHIMLTSVNGIQNCFLIGQC